MLLNSHRSLMKINNERIKGEQRGNVKNLSHGISKVLLIVKKKGGAFSEVFKRYGSIQSNF